MGLAVVRMAILARLLSPDDFGLFALVMIMLGLVESMTESGINYTILQSKQKVEAFVSTAWYISIGRGLLISSLMLVGGIILAHFYHQPQLKTLIWVAAIIPLIKGLINPAIIQFQKQLEFHKESLFHFSRHLVESSLAVLLVWFWPTVISLIVAMIFASLYEVALSFLVSTSRPRREFELTRAREIGRNARGLTLQASLSYVNENLDDLILGRTLGAHGLGLYHNAYALAHKATFEPSKSAYHSIFPILTRVSEDPHRQSGAFRQSILTVGGGLALVALVLMITAKPLVTLLLGEQWLAVIPLVPILAVAGWLQAIANLSYAWLNANRRYRLINLHLALQLSLMGGLIWSLSQNSGLLGAAWAILLARLFFFPLLLLFILPAFKRDVQN